MTFDTADTADPAHAALVEQAAAAAAGVSGVAFLRPGLADRLRSVRHRATNGNNSNSGRPAGVRMTRPDADSPWHVEIHVVALREAGRWTWPAPCGSPSHAGWGPCRPAARAADHRDGHGPRLSTRWRFRR